MENEDYDPAKDPEMQKLFAPAKAFLGSYDAIRKARGEPPFTQDMNDWAEWLEMGEPNNPDMIPVLNRLKRDGVTS